MCLTRSAHSVVSRRVRQPGWKAIAIGLTCALCGSKGRLFSRVFFVDASRAARDHAAQRCRINDSAVRRAERTSGGSHGDGASLTDPFWKGDPLVQMRTAVATFGLVLALLAFGQSSQLHAGPGGTNRPFKGVAKGQVTGISPEGALIVEAAGTATHLGKFTRTEYVFF